MKILKISQCGPECPHFGDAQHYIQPICKNPKTIENVHKGAYLVSLRGYGTFGDFPYYCGLDDYKENKRMTMTAISNDICIIEGCDNPTPTDEDSFILVVWCHRLNPTVRACKHCEEYSKTCPYEAFEKGIDSALKDGKYTTWERKQE